ncbi:hypothetical protein E1B28_013792 [Marasmius oreades]|uniref:Uncharacterized protein n=1 Tax=Marasmius oreades TaxID=181124 RepID=A0A9P7RQG4_9AGAR|nr:uncharacterized protein E1B28_013792 [Marasmius oreades]KAG7087854.1 hypothetical protein E1B28_013792 [Marasmius oreades]
MEPADLTFLRKVITSELDTMPALCDVVHGHVQLKKWSCDQRTLNAMHPDIRDFVQSLTIPTFADDSNAPYLLLEGLEYACNDRMRKKRSEEVFYPKPILVTNTSGAGKTRTLLEALSIAWGFYFICRDPTKEGLGSTDLDESFRELMFSPQFTKRFPNNRKLNFTQRQSMDTNTQLASHIFLPVMLARIVIFHRFIQYVTEDMHLQQTVLYEPYVKRWLDIQLQPWLITQDHEQDIFATLAAKIRDVPDLSPLSMVTLLRQYDREIALILPGFNKQDRLIRIVVDEAQEAANLFPHAFSSSINTQRRRPVLRELLFVWSSHLMAPGKSKSHYTFVITGTGMSKELIVDALSSTTMKPAEFKEYKTIGSFDQQVNQMKYIKRFIPQCIWDTFVGKILMDRMWYWLEGRYRFTAEFITLLLENGYSRPNTLLNQYIHEFAGFTPTDCPQAILEEEARIWAGGDPFRYFDQPECSKTQFDWERLTNHHNGVAVLADLGYKHTLWADTKHTELGKDQRAFIEYGFARVIHRELTESQPGTYIDERLVLNACTVWLNNDSDNRFDGNQILSDDEDGLSDEDDTPPPRRISRPASLPLETAHRVTIPSLYRWISDKFSVSEGGHSLFEDYILFYFLIAFTQTNTQGGPLYKLKEVLDFFDPDRSPEMEDLKERRAKLVSVYYPKYYRQKNVNIKRYTYGSATVDKRGNILRMAGALGLMAKSGKRETKEWLKGEKRELFCFPDIMMGPDILFALELHRDDGGAPSYTWVAVQAKQYNHLSSLDRETVSKAIKSVTPSQFYKSGQNVQQAADDNDNESTVDHNQETLNLLDKITDREMYCAGKHSVLRVIAAWPAEVDLTHHLATPPKGNRRKNAEDIDGTDRHPLATLKEDKFIELTKDLSPLDKLMSIRTSMLCRKKEKKQEKAWVPTDSDAEMEDVEEIEPVRRNVKRMRLSEVCPMPMGRKGGDSARRKRNP